MPSARDVEDLISEDIASVILFLLTVEMGSWWRERNREGILYIFEHFDFSAHPFDLSIVLVLEFRENRITVLAPIFHRVLFSVFDYFFLVAIVNELPFPETHAAPPPPIPRRHKTKTDKTKRKKQTSHSASQV